MAWNYRKRVKVAPGVYLNISKNGVSTTAGVRGSSMTFGKNGTYINTGIPGTGYYNRQRLCSSGRKKPQSVKPVTQIVQRRNFRPAIWMFVFSLFWLLLFWLAHNDANKTYSLVFLICGIILVIYAIVKFVEALKVKPYQENGNNYYLEEARSSHENTNHPILRRILESFINSYDIIDEIDDEEKIIEKLNEKPIKNCYKIEEHQQTLSHLKERLNNVQYDVDAELDEKQIDAYSRMCNAFENLQDCEKVWFITSEQSTTQIKSSASSSVERYDGCVFSGVFNYLKSHFDVPAFEVNEGTLYLYPKFVILARRPGSFRYATYKAVAISSNIQRFSEENGIPKDSIQDGSTWRYVNKDGSPDRRFSDNRQITIAVYGKLTIQFDKSTYTFHFSNYEKTRNFAQTFEDFKASLGENTENDGDRIDKITKSIKNLHKKVNEDYDKKSSSQSPSSPKSKLDFNLALSYATQLYETLIDLNNDKRVIEVLDRYPEQLDPMKTLRIKNIDSRIGVLGAMASIKCFNKLGHEDINSEEGLVISLFLLQLLSPDKKEVWGSETNLRSPKGQEFRKNAYEIFKNNVHIFFDENKIVLIEILRHGGVEDSLVNKFAVKLYRFARIIAEADETITPNEKEWLVNILSFSKQVDSQEEQPKGESPESNVGVQDSLLSDLEKDKKLSEDKRNSFVSKLSDKDALTELNSLIGLSSVKTEIKNIYNLVKIQKVREEKGLKSSSISYHCVFTGNPGTGKTTVARLVAQIYKDLGILSKGHLVETDRSGLVAEYVGQTAVKTNKIIDSALDGVLFIDEAYSLVPTGQNDYGMEAISTLLKRMEDNRDRLVVILAGYSEEMKQFIDTNPGLQSRFNRYVNFEDYNVEDLLAIYNFNLKKFDYKLSEDGMIKLREVLVNVVTNKDKNFGNARYIRNLFEKTLENQARRLAQLTNLTEEALIKITSEDIPQ